VEAWLVAIAALVALGVVGAVAIRRRRVVAAMTQAAAAGPGDDPVAAVRALRERAERAEVAGLAASEDRDAFVGSLAQGVLALDEGLRIVAANATAHELLGREPAALAGRTIIEVFLDTHVEATARAALATGSATGECSPAGADGPRLMIRARRSPSGALWLVLEDVSELRRLQQIRAEFIDNLSHELRTPLTTVSLLAETLTREAEAAGDAIPPRMRDRIDKIEVETGHLVQMVSELLDLSRIESGGALGVVEALDMGRVATESTERLRLFADRQGVTLRVEVAGGLSPVRGDAARLGQVMVNLLHNAVKFSPDGGDVDVSVRRAETGPEVVVAIADHGVGIPRGAQARIFERFYKVDRARVRGETGGTGLGLAIARHIVEQHGGRIWVESTEGIGSTFSFSLPIAGMPAA
jgi:two-component system, OmpR family, phosphate regulon sensor histidine kinase PhoR